MFPRPLCIRNDPSRISSREGRRHGLITLSRLVICTRVVSDYPKNFPVGCWRSVHSVLISLPYAVEGVGVR